jgi:hypothetical protein
MRKSMAERQILRDAVGIGRVHDGALAEPAAVFWLFTLQQMAFAGVAAQDFARAGDLEPLGHGLSCFDAFGSSHKFFISIAKGRALYVTNDGCASANFYQCTCPEDFRLKP